MNDLNDKNAIFNLLRLANELLDQFRTLRSHVQALEWFITEGDDDKMHRLAAMRYVLDQDRSAGETEREQQWQSWLLSKQREIEFDRPEIPS